MEEKEQLVWEFTETGRGFVNGEDCFQHRFEGEVRKSRAKRCQSSELRRDGKV